VTITYHRPAVKSRQIWGGLVPFDGGKPIPWRAGANENTTISFTHDVLIEGKRLGAGTYGLHMIPSVKDWVVIFSKNYTSWGSFSYREDEDALRVTVQPRLADFQEWLSYGFDVNDSFSTTVILHWEKLAVPFMVQVADGEETVLAAAQYCLQRKINTDEALAWTDQAIARGGAFQALQVKSGLLAEAGKKKESEDLLRGAVENATENELNTYGYTLLNENKIKEAVEIFTMNVKRHPDSWNVYDSLGEGHDKAGDKKSALKNYKKALSLAPETQKSRISGILKNLETGL
jgi:tetratricopeptide (TPR) repeat protein